MLRGKNYAEHYDNHFGLVNADNILYLGPIVDQLEWGTNEKILDHGIGTGKSTLDFIVPKAVETNSKIFAFDISDSMLALAKGKYSHPTVTCVKSDLLSDSFPWNDVKFDKIFSLYVLMSDSNYKDTLGKMFELLKPGGQIILFVIAKSILFDMHDNVKHDADWHWFRNNVVTPQWFADDKTGDHKPHFKTTLQEIGFKVKDMHAHYREYLFKSGGKEACIEFLMGQNPSPYETHFADGEKQHKEFHQLYREYLPGEEENVKGEQSPSTYGMDYELVTIVAQK